jgi:hypothetical protein
MKIENIMLAKKNILLFVLIFSSIVCFAKYEKKNIDFVNDSNNDIVMTVSSVLLDTSIHENLYTASILYFVVEVENKSNNDVVLLQYHHLLSEDDPISRVNIRGLPRRQFITLVYSKPDRSNICFIVKKRSKQVVLFGLGCLSFLTNREILNFQKNTKKSKYTANQNKVYFDKVIQSVQDVKLALEPISSNDFKIEDCECQNKIVGTQIKIKKNQITKITMIDAKKKDIRKLVK